MYKAQCRLLCLMRPQCSQILSRAEKDLVRIMTAHAPCRTARHTEVRDKQAQNACMLLIGDHMDSIPLTRL